MKLVESSYVLQSSKDLLAWVKANMRPLVGERTGRNGAFLYLDHPLLVIYTGVKGDREGQRMEGVVTVVLSALYIHTCTCIYHCQKLAMWPP